MTVDLHRARKRPQLELAFIHDRDRALVVGDERRARVDDLLHHLVEVEGRGDLAADREERVELLDLLLGLVLARVAQRADGLAGKVLKQLLVLGSELRVASSLVDEHQRPDGLPVLAEGKTEHGTHEVALVLSGERALRRDVVVSNDPLADQQVSDDRAADGVGSVFDVVVLVDDRCRQDDVGGFRLEEPQGGDFRHAEVRRLADDDLVQLRQVDRRAEGLGEVVEIGQALDRVEHADCLALGPQRAREGRSGVLEERFQPRKLLLGLRRLPEEEREQPHGDPFRLEGDGQTGLGRDRQPFEKGILRGSEVSPVERDRPMVAQQVMDGSGLA